MRSSDPLRLSGYGGGRRWRLVGVAEGRETPKGRGASGGGRTGGGGRGTPKTGRATSGAAKTPRRSPRPAGTTGSASYGPGRTASGRAVPEPRTSRGAADRDAATGEKPKMLGEEDRQKVKSRSTCPNVDFPQSSFSHFRLLPKFVVLRRSMSELIGSSPGVHTHCQSPNPALLNTVRASSSDNRM